MDSKIGFTSIEMEEKLLSKLDNNLFSVKVFDTLPSSNTYAKEYFSTTDVGEKYHIIISREQTSGRGRLGKSFTSTKDKGLYLSFVFRPTLPFSELSLITSYVACATHRILETFSSKELQIKWVNDIYLGDKKCAGILCESVFSSNNKNGCDFTVVGIGINLYSTEFKDELKDIATNVFENNLDLESYCEFIKSLCETLTEYEKIIKPRLHIPYYREKSYLNGKLVELYDNKTEMSKQARVLGISDDAELVVQYMDDTIENIISGDVSVKINKTK